MFTRLSRLVSRSSLRVSSHDVGMDQVTELNTLLEVLSDVFPEHQVVLLRELLLNASQESRLHIAANTLIQNPQRYAENPSRLNPGLVEDWEKFRSTEYKKTVEELLYASCTPDSCFSCGLVKIISVTEFQGLAQSTIRNVLIESNYDYVRGRMALCDIASKSWRFNLVAWISRRRTPPIRPSLDVTKKSTGCARLDDEIYALSQPERDAQSLRDEKLARGVNEDEYSKAQSLLECGCCFGDYTWEDITVCTEGHFFCRGCLDRSVKEALYGQGSCLFGEKGSVRCISSVAVPACEGFVAHALLPHALPPATIEKVDQWFAREQLQSSGLPLVHCPACSYAAVDNPISARLRPWAISALVITAACLCIQFQIWLPSSVFQITVLFFLYRVLTALGIMPMGFSAARAWTSDAMTRARRRKMGVRTIFKCENPQCRLASCIDCGKKWTPFHDCRQAALDNQRLYVERAMSEAVKRTVRLQFPSAHYNVLISC